MGGLQEGVVASGAAAPLLASLPSPWRRDGPHGPHGSRLLLLLVLERGGSMGGGVQGEAALALIRLLLLLQLIALELGQAGTQLVAL